MAAGSTDQPSLRLSLRAVGTTSSRSPANEEEAVLLALVVEFGVPNELLQALVRRNFRTNLPCALNDERCITESCDFWLFVGHCLYLLSFLRISYSAQQE